MHGGLYSTTPIRLNSKGLEAPAQFIPLAPLEQPHNRGPIGTIFQAVPYIPQVFSSTRCFVDPSHLWANRSLSLAG